MNMRIAPRALYNCSTARFDGTARPLTDEELYKTAPSIFAASAHESRSERFRPIPTISVVNELRNEGFFPVAAKQSGSRDPSKRDFTKHLIRFRRMDDVQSYKVGDTVCETILQNGNDGTSLYALMAGLFRIQCMNSLVAQTATVESIKVKHLGKDIPAQVIEGTYTVLEESKKCLAAPQDWSQVQLGRDAKMALAEAAHMIRFGDDKDNGIKPEKMIEPLRRTDQKDDLWTVWNAAQEHVIRGGDRGMRRTEDNRLRRVRTRPINNITQDVKLNQALWLVGEKLYQTLKLAA